MSEVELINVRGGEAINTAILNTLVRLVTASFELGRALGSSIRRMISDNKC
ncbi:MAG: hypothetical protein II762_07445 [Ruminococcus sp.]|nr:hypothetical protein [Ruminococcus sp.]